MKTYDHIIFSSYGNDSISLIEYANQEDLKNCAIVYSDTGWCEEGWKERVDEAEEWVKSLGFSTFRTQSEGFEGMVRRKKGFPMCAGKMQFCTQILKVEPAKKLLEKIDPEKDSTCMIGIRRQESANRSDFPEFTESSEKHGGRELWAPLVNLSTQERDVLISYTPFTPLPHRSRECFPCVCSNKEDLQWLSSEKIEYIANLEKEMGFTKNNKPRVMFRPYRCQGATGIKEVIQWAYSNHGKYNRQQKELFPCTSGYCGM